MSCAGKRGTPATVPGRKVGYSSLFLKATEPNKSPVACAFGIYGIRRGGMTGEDGTAVMDSIPAGRWVVRSVIIPNPEQLDTLDFVAGHQETLWIEVFGWSRHSVDVRVTKSGEWISTSTPDTVSKYQRRLRP
jgi:hypothetical protein